jgi:hypothetical protein
MVSIQVPIIDTLSSKDINFLYSVRKTKDTGSINLKNNKIIYYESHQFPYPYKSELDFLIEYRGIKRLFVTEWGLWVLSIDKDVNFGYSNKERLEYLYFYMDEYSRIEKITDLLKEEIYYYYRLLKDLGFYVEFKDWNELFDMRKYNSCLGCC